MPGAVLVRNPEELTQAAISLLEGKIEVQDINISNDFCIRIKIIDKTWTNSKKIDYKIAGLVLDLQRDLLGLYNSISGESITLKNIHRFDKNFVVKVEVNDGCIEAITKLAGFFKAAVLNMDSKYKILAIALVCGTLAYGGDAWLKYSYLESVEKTKIKKLDEETKQQATQAVKEVALALANNKDTPKHLASRITPEGEIEFGNGEKFSRKALKDSIRESEEIEDKKPEFNYTIDATYDVPAYNYEDQTAKIRVKGFEFDASTRSLPEDVKRNIQQLANEADLKGTFARINLQVVGRFKGNELIESFITGIGLPREGSVEIMTILSKSQKASPKSVAVQGSLLGSIDSK